MVTADQVKLIQETWDQVKATADLEEIGRLVFVRLFTVNPELLPLFPFAAECDTPEKLKSSTRLGKHGLNVTKTLDKAVTGLDDLPAVAKVLSALGKRHVKYKATRAHFPPVAAAITHTLELGLGDGWTPEVAEAWKALLTIVADVIGKELEE